MSIIDTHWTDSDIADLAQVSLDGLFGKLGLERMIVEAFSFFLNPALLASSPDTMRDGVRRILCEILPPDAANELPDHAADTFMGLGDLSYVYQGKLVVIFSRPDKASSLSERINSRTLIKKDDIVLDANAVSCGFDNLELISRIFEIFNCMPNGGVQQFKARDSFNIMQYRSMLGARGEFLSRGGTVDVLRLHEAANHVAAFTKGRIPYEYTGFMNDLGLNEFALTVAYSNIFKKMVAGGYSTRITEGGRSSYTHLSVDNLLLAMSELLDQYANPMTERDGKAFAVFHAAMTSGDARNDEGDAVVNLTAKEKIRNTEQLIVYQTLKGLHLLMGDNTLQYVPRRENSSLARIDNFLTPRVA